MEVNGPELVKSISFITPEEAEEEEKNSDQFSKIVDDDEEEKFLEHKLKNFEYNVTDKGVLDKKSMSNLMKVIGEFAEFRSKELIPISQEKRMQYYMKEHQKYVMACHGTLLKEEDNFNYSSAAVLHKVKINKTCLLYTSPSPRD